jgi:hypothetical protein
LENDEIVIHGVRFLGCTLWTDFLLYGAGVQAEAEQYAMRHMNDFLQAAPLIRHPRTEESATLGRAFTPFDSGQIHSGSMHWLKEKLSDVSLPTVVVTHHAPARQSIDPKYNSDSLTPAFVSNHDEFVESSGARMWIHGHVHRGFDYRLGETRVLCNPRGYPQFRENLRFQPDLVVEV